jgi:hypothetical protein
MAAKKKMPMSEAARRNMMRGMKMPDSMTGKKKGKSKKKAKTYKGKSMKPGGGGRFAKMVDALKKKGKSAKAAKAIAAAAGRKKYGAKRMAGFAAKGRKRSGGKKK